eukprot:TRINITY_DN14830_c0_g1_i1.p1 TRINITY_DN14830_c0_g1~~TRINITY_DN14830_c0_g1_i1.p1  ORF type:complete len:369 (-),score=51.39 TRINITY_DN14830_c0_g1_i1:73-1179(-)
MGSPRESARSLAMLDREREEAQQRERQNQNERDKDKDKEKQPGVPTQPSTDTTALGAVPLSTSVGTFGTATGTGTGTTITPSTKELPSPFPKPSTAKDESAGSSNSNQTSFEIPHLVDCGQSESGGIQHEPEREKEVQKEKDKERDKDFAIHSSFRFQRVTTVETTNHNLASSLNSFRTQPATQPASFSVAPNPPPPELLEMRRASSFPIPEGHMSMHSTGFGLSTSKLTKAFSGISRASSSSTLKKHDSHVNPHANATVNPHLPSAITPTPTAAGTVDSALTSVPQGTFMVDLDDDTSPAQMHQNALWNSALLHYFHGDWQLARGGFQEILQLVPRYGPAMALLSYMEKYKFIAPFTWAGWRKLEAK